MEAAETPHSRTSRNNVVGRCHAPTEDPLAWRSLPVILWCRSLARRRRCRHRCAKGVLELGQLLAAGAFSGGLQIAQYLCRVLGTCPTRGRAHLVLASLVVSNFTTAS